MAATKARYGFRHDPMAWVEKDRSLQGAMVRVLVLGEPKRGDKKRLADEIDTILAKQLPDGRLSDDPQHSYQFTSEALIRLARLGCPAGRREVGKAVEAVLAKPKPNQADPYGIYDVRAFCRLGLAQQPKFAELCRKGLAGIVAREEEWADLYEGCPWTPIEHLITLWYGRKMANVELALVRTLKKLAEGINDAGCISYKDPWGYVRLAGVVDHPLARKILEKEVGVVLRGQQPDGGWGDRTYFVFRALKKHGLLEPLRRKPPLPPDWRIVKTIPAPAPDCLMLAWDGQHLWTRCTKTNQAVAVSPADGAVARRVKLPSKSAFGLATWDGGLAVTDKKAKKLLRIDPATGKVTREIDLAKMEWINGLTEVGGKLAVGDGFMGNVMIFDPAKPAKPRPCILGGPIPLDLATDGAAVWHVDIWAPAILKSDLGGHSRLLDWGDKPFDGRCDGIAHDGTHLWVLDRKGQRLCAIEKAAEPRKAKDRTRPAAKKPAKPKLERKDGVVCIRGLEAINWGGSFFTRQESFMACLTEVLRCAGREAAYAEVMGLSGAAFKLTTGTDNWCPSEAISDVGADCPERALRTLGFEREMIQLDEKKHPGARERARKAIVASIDAGLPVPYMDGERSLVVGYRDGGKAFLCMPYAGSASGYKEMSALKGMLGDAWFVEVIRRKGRATARRKAVLDSLANALVLARTPSLAKGTRNGLAAYGAWIRKLEKPPEKANLHGHAYDYSILLTSRQAAAEFLRSVAGQLKPAAARHLRTAARLYGQVGTRLWDGRSLVAHPWDKSWTPENRAAEAEIMKKCRDDERKAVKAIEAALAAEGIEPALAAARIAMAPPGDHPQALLGEAVKAFDHMQKRIASHDDWGEGMYPYPQPCVYLQMHWVEMQAAGWKTDFDTLVAVSGASALFAYEPKTFMPKYANLSIGMDERIAQATGFGYEWVPFKDADDAWRIIKETVDSGRVAKGWDWENCAFCGYQEAAKPEARKVFALGDGPGTFSVWWTWEEFTAWADRITQWKQARLGRHTSRVAVRPAKEIALRVMADLVAWSAEPPEACRKRFPKAAFGLAGIERYAADCANLEEFPDWVMCHGINPQWTVRHSSAVYLAGVAKGKLVPKKAREPIARAAKGYKAAAEAWHKTYGLLGHGATEQQRRTKKRRQAAAAAIRKALEHEKKAIGELRLALAAVGEAASAGAEAWEETRPAKLVALSEKRFDDGLPKDAKGMMAGVPCAHVQALNHAGSKITFAEFAAMSGWAFSFGYKYGDISPAFMAVKGGGPEKTGPYDVFAFVPHRLGYDFESAPVKEKDKLWAFVRKHIDAGTPIISEHFDGGLMCGYRHRGAEREVWFVGGPIRAWVPIDKLHPFEVCALVKKRRALPRKQLIRQALARAVAYAEPHEAHGAAQGLAALDAYVADMGDPKKTFEKCAEYLNCWAAYERLFARKAAAIWLRSAANALGGHARKPLLAAAGHYDRAYGLYSRTRRILVPKEGQEGLTKRARSPEIIAQIVPLLREAADAERAGLAELRKALAAEGTDGPAAKANQQVTFDAGLNAAREIGTRTHDAYWQTRCYVVGRSICLTAAGAPDADYETLMTVSGFGTAFAYHPKHAFVTYWPPAKWEDAQGAIDKATGYKWENLPPAKTPDAAWKLLTETIDDGKALMGYFFMGEHVFLGYQDAPREADRRILLAYPFEFQGTWWTWKEFAEWSKKNGFGRVGRKVRRGDAKKLAIAAMKRAVASADGDDRSKREEVPPDVTFGVAGIEAFAADVADVNKAPDAFDGGWLGCHAIMPQVSGRRSAAVYLRRASGKFSKKVARHIAAAADAYDAAFAAWGEWRKQLGADPACTQLDDIKKRWRVKARRRAGAAAIRKAIGHERKAIGELGQALAAAAR